MVKLNDYLYDGNTVLRILHQYASDLKADAQKTHNPMDLDHSNFLMRYTQLLEHNEFLTSQSRRILEFYQFLAEKYPFLAFIFKGRIKSLIRTEEKYNGYITEIVSKQYLRDQTLPSVAAMKDHLGHFRDLIAYRIVISIPACHLAEGENREETELRFLYEIANALLVFMEERGFTAQLSQLPQDLSDSALDESVRPYYRDYILHPKDQGYQSLHITFFDNEARTYVEIQLRTKEMDDAAEIGVANHDDYEHQQEKSRVSRLQIPEGLCPYYDDALERIRLLQNLDYSKLDVNMFAARDSHLMNDACGLYRGRLILPYEHLSRFQNNLISLPGDR